MREPTRRNKPHAKELERQGIHVVELDVTNQRSIDQAIRFVLKKTERLDVLINNAGIASAGVTEAFTAEQAKALFDVNVFGVHRVTRAVLPTFRRQNDGLIINVGSILGRVTFPFFGLYGASKFAVEALTDSLRYELSQLGIEVALVQPSAFPTNMYESAMQPHDTNRVQSYGAVGEIPATMFAEFMAMFASENAPNPQEVARSISALVEAPKGQRSDRTVVGSPFGADQINAFVAPVQFSVLDGLGLAELQTLKTAEKTAELV
jgi:NADP-dependent 3-hydroxy acid dehydrogenase YdfG